MMMKKIRHGGEVKGTQATTSGKPSLRGNFVELQHGTWAVYVCFEILEEKFVRMNYEHCYEPFPCITSVRAVSQVYPYSPWRCSFAGL